MFAGGAEKSPPQEMQELLASVFKTVTFIDQDVIQKATCDLWWKADHERGKSIADDIQQCGASEGTFLHSFFEMIYFVRQDKYWPLVTHPTLLLFSTSWTSWD